MPHRRLNLNLNKIESDIIDELLARGWNQSEMMRQAIREFGDRNLPPEYVKAMRERKPKDDSPYQDWSPEDVCVKLKGGTVDGEYCVIPIGDGGEKRIALDKIKEGL